MDIALVSPDLRQGARRMSGGTFASAWRRRLVQAALALMPATRTAGVRIKVRRTPAAGLRVHEPAVRKSPGALLWIHGGGLVIGRAVQDDRLCGATAAALGVTVVSVDYRLAPRHPFPAALDDAFAAWTWLRASAGELGVDPTKIAVGGVSAGGGLAASLAQRIHDEGAGPAAAQWLFCPMLDDRTAARRELDSVQHFVWNNRENEFGWRSYLGAAPGAADIPPYASAARREDLRGLPPAWIGVGDIDLFHDEDRRYAERLRDAGVSVTFHAIKGAPHGFESWAPRSQAARSCLAEAQAWLAAALAREGAPAG